MKFTLILLPVVLLAASLVSGQSPPKARLYAGGIGGIATLSGDGSAVVTRSAASTSLFDPKNGGAGEVFAGIHLFEYVSFEADYGWNRNNAILVSTSSAPGATSFFRGPESITQNSFLGNVSVYFRKRGSRVRPYLSEGAGAVLIHSRLSGGAIVEGSPALPPAASSHASVALRTLTGIDVRLRGPWYFRYSFGETITRNALGNQVSPSQHRIPKNFQNLFGFYLQL
ncbi:MAG: outer membrane beta-barrel protein [Acidobacteriota bacterium]|nr:outer membrane beta-barrel protein [Acidobacteriota bacterium]